MTTIHTIAAELTRWHQSRVPYTFEGTMASWETYHTTEVPPLITQLDESPTATAGLAHSTPASRPPASLDALDTLVHIDHEAARWVRKLGHDDPGNTIACIQKLYSLAASAHYCGQHKPTIEDRAVTCCDVHRIEKDMRRWWTQARIVSGWDQAAWAPNNTCPMCDERRTLRIRVDDRTALCTNCRETWTEGTIGLLAEHVRAENNDVEAISGEGA